MLADQQAAVSPAEKEVERRRSSRRRRDRPRFLHCSTRLSPLALRQLSFS
jgi:hypothetical protein